MIANQYYTMVFDFVFLILGPAEPMAVEWTVWLQRIQ
jgi:hypothetical protein